MKKRNNKKGFTIVELVIVIAVIAILAAVLIPTFSSVVEKANESSALQACRNELVEMKVAYATQGGDIAEGTILSSNDYYFEYKDGQLVKCNKPENKKSIKVNNIEVYNANEVSFDYDWMQQKAAGSVCAGIKCSASSTQYALTVYKDGALFYTENGTNATFNNGVYFYLFANGTYAGVGTWYIQPATQEAAAGYYTYELSVGDTKPTTGIFYYDGK